MCSNCSPHRDTLCPAEHAAIHPEPEACTDPVSRYMRAPISRSRLLKAAGGGLGAALTAGALNWTPTPDAAASLPYVVLIVLDGARSEYLNVSGIPHVRSLIRNGIQYTNA